MPMNDAHAVIAAASPVDASVRAGNTMSLLGAIVLITFGARRVWAVER